VVRGGSDLIGILRAKTLTVIKKHITLDNDNVHVRLDRGPTVSLLEIDVEIPISTGVRIANAV